MQYSLKSVQDSEVVSRQVRTAVRSTLVFGTYVIRILDDWRDILTNDVRGLPQSLPVYLKRHQDRLLPN
jgi:hypothetical protein